MAAHSDKVLALGDANFAEVVEAGSGLTVVDFGADWCGPCRLMNPVIDRIAESLDGQVKVGAVDVDANPQVSARFSVRNLPTFLFFKDGALVDRVIGAVPEPVLTGKIREHL